MSSCLSTSLHDHKKAITQSNPIIAKKWIRKKGCEANVFKDGNQKNAFQLIYQISVKVHTRAHTCRGSHFLCALVSCNTVLMWDLKDLQHVNVR